MNFLSNPLGAFYTYYYPKEKLTIPFLINTKDNNVGKKRVEIRITKIYIPPEGNNITIHYEYTDVGIVLNGGLVNYKVTVPLVGRVDGEKLDYSYSGFYMSGGPYQDLGPGKAQPWKWWKSWANETGTMPHWIRLSPMVGDKDGKSEFKRKSEMLSLWKKAWGQAIYDSWSGQYPNMVLGKTPVPAFSTSIKAAENPKNAEKIRHMFLFTTFVKDETKASVTDASGAEGFKPRLKF